MGAYIYAATGKTVTVHMPDGVTVEAKVAPYQFKPYYDLWRAAMHNFSTSLYSGMDRRLVAHYKRRLAAWKRMAADGKGSRYWIPHALEDGAVLMVFPRDHVYMSDGCDLWDRAIRFTLAKVGSQWHALPRKATA